MFKTIVVTIVLFAVCSCGNPSAPLSTGKVNFYVRGIGPYFFYPLKNDTLIIETNGSAATNVITDSLGRASKMFNVGNYSISPIRPLLIGDTIYPKTFTVTPNSQQTDTITIGNPRII